MATEALAELGAAVRAWPENAKYSRFGLPAAGPSAYAAPVSAPPHAGGSPRRHRSQQRERILAWLRATDTHPTAAEIHGALAPSLPALSLATVYRNLEVLVAEGEIDEVPTAVGATRYDGNVEPHHHFHCDHCGRIVDVELPVPRGVVRRLAADYGLRSERTRMDFFGRCPECEGDVPVLD